MAKPPAFQFYAADYLADAQVQLMTLEEEGAYIRLLSYCWREGGIPDDSAALSRLCKGCNIEVIERVKCMFEPHKKLAGILIQKRLEIERRKATKFRDSRSKAGTIGGKNSGKVRREKSYSTKHSFDFASSKTEAKRSSSSSSSISTSVTPPVVPLEAAAEEAPPPPSPSEIDWNTPDPQVIARELAGELHAKHPALCARNMAEAAAEREMAQAKPEDPVRWAEAVKRTHAAHCELWREQQAERPGAFVPQLHVWFRDQYYLQATLRAVKPRASPRDKGAFLRRMIAELEAKGAN